VVCALVVLLISVLAWAPFLYPGFIQTHSGLGAIYDALSAGAPLSGWTPTYATPGDGTLATWTIVLLAKMVGLLKAVRLLYTLAFMFSGAGMFLLARRFWGEWAAIASAAVYMLLPYHLSVVYVRGSVAEAALLALAPFLFLALVALRHTPRWPAWLAAMLLSMALVLANAGLGALVVLMALLTTVLVTPAANERVTQDGAQRPVLLAATATLAGIIAGALVVLPAGERALAGMPGWQDHFVHLFQLFLPVWGFGESVAGWQDGMSFQIGVVAIVLTILALWSAHESGDRRLRRNVLWLLALTSLPVLLALTVSARLWSIVPLALLVAYPWQLLAVAAVPLSLLAAGGVASLIQPGHPARFTLLAVALAAIVLGSYAYLAPRFVDDADIPALSQLPLARLGEDILLLDARVDRQAQAGQPLHATLFWQALRQPGADLTTFTHLVDASGQTRGQMDVRPHDGAKPTNTWLSGEIVRDDIEIPVPADALPGDYRLQVGMYLLATLQRLPIAGAEDGAWNLGPIAVK
jgi:hypothetical protein